MKKIIFGVFAHPDDEAFGPSGTLLLETRAGTELHLITLTNGEKGANPDGLSDLGSIREQEWRKAGELLGATSMQSLHYRDGELGNNAMIKISRQIIAMVHERVTNIPEDTEIEFMTLDLNGYTGHIDHIVAARATCFAFYRLRDQDKRFTRVRLASFTNSLYPTSNTDWIYMESGRTQNEIDEVVDARNLREDILTIMQAHHSQRSDYESAIKSQGKTLGLNYFVIKN